MPPRLDPLKSDSQSAHRQREPLAVVGMGCRLPGGIDSPSAFWEALLDGIDAIRDVPADRWDHSRFHDTNPEKSGVIRNAKVSINLMVSSLAISPPLRSESIRSSVCFWK